MALPILTQGITVTYENSISVAQTVGGVVDVSWGGGTASEIDTTSLADSQKTFAQGLADRGSVDLTLIANLDDVGQIELLDALENQSTREMVITMPSGTLTIDTFQAFTTSISNDGTVDDKLMHTVTMKITGAIVRS